ncbi:spore gernimation protein [Mesobacillus campisalis]|uniref:Spore gernimation protein n=1 Tax=Mesobacillus campisalis TaxID=1408103 RepID=A0A0M2SVM7_9BACI|nr:Ger(x)C family spore germination protein [Mesobacillus campisalis]KKK38218.1 spore gernimation protein [Mesobacillus campisalis]
MRQSRLVQASLFVFLAAMLTGCGSHVPLEDLTISLILGVDLDEKNNLVISESSPVFNQDAKQNIESYQLKAETVRDSRKYFDALATGEVTAAKIQVLLIGKRVLEHEDWFPVLDTVYRNPTFSLNTRVVVVDGPVSDVMFYVPPDKPQMPLHLKEVIDKNIDRTRAVISTLQVLHRQMYESGMTPSLSVIKKEKDVEFTGVVLLDKKGKYVDTIDAQNSAFLLILRDEKKQELTLTIPMTSLGEGGGIFHKNQISFDVSRVKTDVKTSYNKGKFDFKYQIAMTVNVAERLFPAGRVNQKELEKMIEKELKNRLEDMVKKFQANKIDPIGLGIHARAYQYEQYKKVKPHWDEAFAESNIDVSVDVRIKSMGAVN